MEQKTLGLFKFLGFVIFQLMVSLTAIAIYKHMFLLSNRVLLYHMIIVLLIHGSLIIGLTFILSKVSIREHRATKYLPAFLGSCVGIFFYAVYMLAFLGKQYTNQVYTFNMLFGYIKDYHIFMQTLSIGYTSIFLFLFFIPICIVGWHMLFANIIFEGLISLQKIFFTRRSVPVIITIALFLFGTGFCTGVLVFNYSKIVYSMYYREEPIISACQEMPLQSNMYFGHNVENPLIRTKYLKNGNFEKLNVVIIVVDALRADHLSLFGYKRNTSPFIDSLFREGKIRKVDRSFANSSGSFASILTILRGRYWPEMGENDFSLQDLLKDQGYIINFLISGNHRAFHNLKNFYGKSIDFYFDGDDTRDYVVNDDRLIFEAFKKIPMQKEKSAFFYIHLNSVHVAGYRLPEYRVFMPYQHHRAIAADYINNYDNGIVQADDYVKKIFQLLQEKGYLQRSVVIITADHGESLGERGFFSHAQHLYTDEILVPMLIYDSDKTVAYKGLGLATQVDVAATIVDRLGLPIPDSWSGNSLLKKEKQEYSFHYTGHWRAVIHNNGNHMYKYLYNQKTKQEEIYDLKTDLYEENNIINRIKPCNFKYLI